MSSIRNQLEGANLLLSLATVGVGLITFGVFSGATFSESIRGQPIVHAGLAATAALIVLVAGIMMGRFMTAGWRKLADQRSSELVSCHAKIDELERQLETPVSGESAETPPFGVRDDSSLPPPTVQVWLKPMRGTDEADLFDHTKYPIVVIANLKGGVAKTMTAANLAAYFACRNRFDPLSPSRNTLLIDLDYQGSLSSMMLNAFATGTLHPNSKSQTLFDHSISDLDSLHYRVEGRDQASRISFFPTEYGFDDFETRAQFEWLSGLAEQDVRLLLSRRLRSREFQDEFQMAFIDTGPRLTTGSVAALAAATHLVVPTACDLRSVTAAIQFLRRVAEMKLGNSASGSSVRVCPQLKVAGILLTLTTSYTNDRAMRESAKSVIQDTVKGDASLRSIFVDPEKPVFEALLPRSQQIVNDAQYAIPYLRAGGTRNIVNAIGRELEKVIS